MISSKSSKSYLENQVREEVQQPPNDKLKKLKGRWNQLDYQMQKKKQFRQWQFMEQLGTLETKVTDINEEFESNLKGVQAELKSPLKMIGELKSRRLALQQNSEDKIERLKDSVSRRLNEKSKKAESFQLLTQQNVDGVILQKCAQFEEERRRSQIAMSALLSQASSKLSKLEKVFVQSHTKRQMITQEVTSSMEVQLNKCYNLLSVETKVREQTQSKLFKMIKQVKEKLQSQMRTEQEERVKTNSAIMRLLQETCFRAQDQFQ